MDIFEEVKQAVLGTPVFDEVKATHDYYRATARLEARQELAKELKKIKKPTKQVADIIKGLESDVRAE